MRPLRLCLAFLGGAWLYYVAVILFGGTMAAISIPRGYFSFIGSEHREFALAVLSLVTWALPVGSLVCAGFLALHRLLHLQSRALVFSLALLGMVGGLLFWATAPGSGGLWRSFVLPWWALPSFLAPWVGAALAIWLASRNRVSLGHARAEA